MNEPTRREALAATVGGAVAMTLAAGGSAAAQDEKKEPQKGGRREVQFDVVNLAHIKENSFDARTLEFFDNSISFGPVRIEYQLDLSVPQITFSVYLLGTRIGGGTINPTNPSLTVGGSIDGFKAEVKLTADFAGRKVTYDIALETPLGGKHYSGTLFSW